MNNPINEIPRLHAHTLLCPCNRKCYAEIVALRKDKKDIIQSILIDFFHKECKSINDFKLMQLGIVRLNDYSDYRHRFFGRCQGIERLACRVNLRLDSNQDSFNKSIFGLIKLCANVTEHKAA